MHTKYLLRQSVLYECQVLAASIHCYSDVFLGGQLVLGHTACDLRFHGWTDSGYHLVLELVSGEITLFWRIESPQVEGSACASFCFVEWRRVSKAVGRAMSVI